MLAQVYYETQTTAEADPMVTAVTFGLALLLGIFYTACVWRIFTKAGRPGWHALIPILNTYTLIKVAGRPGWWLVLTFLPCVSFVVIIVVYLDLAKQFNKGAGFGLGLVFLSPIFLPILAFGSASYFTEPEWRRSPRPALPYSGAGYSGGYGGAGFGGAPAPVAPGFGGPAAAPSALPSPPVAPGSGWPAAPGPQGLPPLAPSTAPSTTAPAPAPAAPDVPSNSPTPAPPPFRGGTPDVVAAAQDAGQGGLVAGWYEDPGDPAMVRWWDGGGWTAHTRPRPSD